MAAVFPARPAGVDVDTGQAVPRPSVSRRVARAPHWLWRTALYMAILRAADAHPFAEPDVSALPWTPGADGLAAPRVGPYVPVCRDGPWFSLSVNEKAGRALACAKASSDVGLTDAIERIRDALHWAVMTWREEGNRTARAHAWHAAAGATRETLCVLTALAMYGEDTPGATRAQFDARARALLAAGEPRGDSGAPDVETSDLEALYARQLILDTDDWLSLDALHRQALSPVDLLGHTYRWCGSTLSNDVTPEDLSRGAFDRCGVELAAVLDARVAGDVPTLASVTGLAPLVASFEKALQRDGCVRWWGRVLLPASAVPRGLAPVWFDGSTLQGATGMDFHQLVAHLSRRHEVLKEVLSAAFMAAPGHCRFLDDITLGDIVLDRLKVMMESTDYPFGTPHQSLATVLLRLGPLHGIDPSHIDEPERLFARYAALEAAWRAAPRYPVAPHIAAAFHLARASGVLIRDARPLDAQLTDIVRERYAPLIDTAQTNTALARWLRARRWTLWRDLPAMAQAPDLSVAPAAPRAAVEAYRRLRSLPQRWEVLPGKAGALALATYLESRLLAYGTPPTCVETASEPGGACAATPDREGAIRAIETARHDEAAFLRRVQAYFRSRPRAHSHTNARRTARSPVTHFVPPLVAVPRGATDDDAVALRTFLTRVLIVSTLADQAQRPNATALDFVPFVGSAYALGKGLRDRDPGEALRGAFGFGLDALFVWLSGATEQMVGRQVARLASEVGLAPHEPTALAMLADVGTHLGVAHPGDLPAGNVLIDANPSGLAQRLAPRDAVPDADGTLLDAGSVSSSIGRDRASTSSMATLTWEEALTSRHTPSSSVDEGASFSGDAVVRAPVPFPARAPARTGSPLPWRSPVQDALVPRTRSLTPLRARVSRLGDALHGTRMRHGSGERDLARPSDFFLSRATVEKTRAFVQARDFIARIGAEPGGDGLPDLNRLLRVADAANEAAARDFQQVCQALRTFAKGSQTLRALLRVAAKERVDPATRFAVRFQSGSPPRCDLQRNQIVLPPVDAPFDVSYVDARGATPFQRERAWLHELVHALTGLEDVAEADRVAHRGAVVYFTDRILFEAGPEVPERVMYRHARPYFASGLPRVPDPVIEAGRHDAAVTTLAEDVFLDRLLRSRMKWGAAETILGTPVAQRLTVRQVTALRSLIAAQDGVPGGADDALPLPDIHPRLYDAFQTALSAGDDLPRAIARSGSLVKVAATLYEHDTSFRFLFNRWYRTQMRGADWQVLRGASTPEAPRGWTLDRAARRLALHEDLVFYASELGPRRLESDRRLVGALVDLVTPPEPEVAPDAEPRLNRGLLVYLENRALQVLRGARRMLDAPARVSAEWSHDASSLWKSVNKAHRAAQAEDALLAMQQER